MYSVTRRIECDIGHRIHNHQSQCKNIHGHRYVIEATCTSTLLIRDGDSKDMVIDFSFLKDEMMREIHNPCDHGLILARNDPLRPFLLMRRVIPSSETKCKEEDGEGWQLTQTDFGKLYVINSSPTAEVLAEHWYTRLRPKIKHRSDSKAQLEYVKVWETPNCSAIYPFS